MNNCYQVKPGMQRWSLALWWLTTILLGWNAVAFPNIRSGRKFFFLICLCHAPTMVGRKEPEVLLQPFGRDRVPMFFWGPLMDQGRWICIFISLDPDGCLVADQLKIWTTTVWKTGAGNEKELNPIWIFVSAKNGFFFCDGLVFFIDTNLLMGAIVLDD